MYWSTCIVYHIETLWKSQMFVEVLTGYLFSLCYLKNKNSPYLRHGMVWCGPGHEESSVDSWVCLFFRFARYVHGAMSHCSVLLQLSTLAWNGVWCGPAYKGLSMDSVMWTAEFVCFSFIRYVNGEMSHCSVLLQLSIFYFVWTFSWYFYQLWLLCEERHACNQHNNNRPLLSSGVHIMFNYSLFYVLSVAAYWSVLVVLS